MPPRPNSPWDVFPQQYKAMLVVLIGIIRNSAQSRFHNTVHKWSESDFIAFTGTFPIQIYVVQICTLCHYVCVLCFLFVHYDGADIALKQGVLWKIRDSVDLDAGLNDARAV